MVKLPGCPSIGASLCSWQTKKNKKQKKSSNSLQQSWIRPYRSCFRQNFWIKKVFHFPPNRTCLFQIFVFFFAPQNYVLLAIRPQKLFRHSFIAIYDVYDIRSGVRTKLHPPLSVLQKLAPPGDFQDGGPPDNFPGSRPGGPPPPLPLLYATWSPKGSSLVYVFSNNVFFRATPTSEDIPLSTSGNTSLLLTFFSFVIKYH